MADTDITPTVLVTGPTRGLGLALVRRLVRHPARPALLLAGRDPAALREVADEARRAGTRVRTVALDLADLGSVAAAAQEGCSLLLTEDLQDGFTWRGVTLRNPFAAGA